MIALGTVTGQPLLEQILVVSIVAIVATIGVYGIVALMVRMDDTGMKFIQLARDKSKFVKSSFVIIGKGLVYSLPKLIKLLGVIGTIAMLLVGGGMFVHNIQEIHDFFRNISETNLEHFRKKSGAILETIRKNSRTFPEDFRKISGANPEHFWTFSGTNLEKLRKCSVNIF